MLRSVVVALRSQYVTRLGYRAGRDQIHHTYPRYSTCHVRPLPRRPFSTSCADHVREPNSILHRLETTHCSLRTFLEHTLWLRFKARSGQPVKDGSGKLRSTSLTSTVFLGTRYEYLIQEYLGKEWGMRLVRVGARGDRGLDLVGRWEMDVPRSEARRQAENEDKGEVGGVEKVRFDVRVQAKRLSATRKASPSMIRELEGAVESSHVSSEDYFERMLEEDEGSDGTDGESNERVGDGSSNRDIRKPILGILITTSTITEGVKKAMVASRNCLMYVCLEELPTVSTDVPSQRSHSSVNQAGSESEDGVGDIQGRTRIHEKQDDAQSDVLLAPDVRIRQILWNQAATNAGLQNFGVGTRIVKASSTLSEPNQEQELVSEAVLLYRGKPVKFEKSGQSNR